MPLKMCPDSLGRIFQAFKVLLFSYFSCCCPLKVPEKNNLRNKRRSVTYSVRHCTVLHGEEGMMVGVGGIWSPVHSQEEEKGQGVGPNSKMSRPTTVVRFLH